MGDRRVRPGDPRLRARSAGGATRSTTPRWRDALLDRCARMVERDKNHPSVVMWSLGNECGTGANLAAMAAWTRERDPSRPLHYEGDRSCARHRRLLPDVRRPRRGRAASAAARRSAAGRPRTGRPAPARCRSSCASTRTPWATAPAASGRLPAAVRALPALPGRVRLGVDRPRPRAAPTTGASSSPTAATSARRCTTATSSATAWSSPTGRRRPGLVEYKKVIEPVRHRAADPAGAIRVTNRTTSATCPTCLRWPCEEEGCRSADGALDVPALPPGGRRPSTCPTLPPDRPPGSAGSRSGRCSPPTRRGPPPATRSPGASCPDPADPPRAPGSTRPGHGAARHPPGPGPVTRWRSVAQRGGGGPVSTAPGSALRHAWARELRPGTGRLVPSATCRSTGRGWTCGGRRPTTTAGTTARPCEPLWRRRRAAPAHGTGSTRSPSGDGALVVRTRVAPAGTDLGLRRHLPLDGGARRAAAGARASSPRGTGPARCPGSACAWPCPAGLRRVEWFGRGPRRGLPRHRPGGPGRPLRGHRGRAPDPVRLPAGERQPGRRALGRPDRRRRERAQGRGRARPSSSPPGRWTSEQLDAARHPTDLRPGDRVWVNLDLAQQGIGSASCGPGVLPAYRLDPAPASFTVRLYPAPAGPSRR